MDVRRRRRPRDPARPRPLRRGLRRRTRSATPFRVTVRRHERLRLSRRRTSPGSTAGALPMGARLRLKASQGHLRLRAGGAEDLPGDEDATGSSWPTTAPTCTSAAPTTTRWDNDILNPAFDASDGDATSRSSSSAGSRRSPRRSPSTPTARRLLQRQRRSRAGGDRLRRAELAGLRDAAPSALTGVASAAAGPPARPTRWTTPPRPTGRPPRRSGELRGRRPATAIALSVSNPATRPAAHWDASVPRDRQRRGGEDVDAACRQELHRRAGRAIPSTRRSRRSSTPA